MSGSVVIPELQPWKGLWNRITAAHLLRRAGFGGNPANVDRVAELGLDESVAELLAFDREDDRELRADLAPLLEAAEIDALAGWWLYRMRFGRSPLREKLALFWHGHFATSNDQVQNVKAMAGQLFVFLDHAAGTFRNLLHAIVRDPAMLLFLDGAESDVQHPNENLARELFELFSLGRGHYQEIDVLEAARALTGATLRQGSYRFDPDRHDSGEKRVLGKRGRLNAEDVVEAALAQPACSRHLARAMLESFVEPKPSLAVIDGLAQGLRENDYSIAWGLGTILRSRIFYDVRVRRALVKSPVELAVGLLQALDATGNFKELVHAIGRMGQSLLRPPSVRGWRGGMAWIDAATLMERHGFPARMMDGTYGKPPDHTQWPDVETLVRTLGLDDISGSARERLASVAPDARLQAAAALPEYQLN